jgi:hypothetical protein
LSAGSEGPSRGSPVIEGRALFKIFRATKESAEAIRALVAAAPDASDEVKNYREAVLGFFNAFVSRGYIYKFKFKPKKVKDKLTPKVLQQQKREQARILDQLERVRKFIFSCMVCERKIKSGEPVEPEERPAPVSQKIDQRKIAPTPEVVSEARKSGPRQKLSNRQVSAVNAAIASGATIRDLAGRFNVCEVTLARAIARRKQRGEPVSKDWQAIRAAIENDKSPGKAKAATA